MPSDDTITTNQRSDVTPDSTIGPAPVGGSRADTARDPHVNRARADAIFHAMRTGSTTQDLQKRFGEGVAATPEGQDAADRAARMRAAQSRQRRAVQEADSQEAGKPSQSQSQSAETRGQRANRRAREAREARQHGQDQGLGR